MQQHSAIAKYQGNGGVKQVRGVLKIDIAKSMIKSVHLPYCWYLDFSKNFKKKIGTWKRKWLLRKKEKKKESKSWWLRGQVIDKIEEDKQEIDYEVKLLTIWAEKGQKITSSDII